MDVGSIKPALAEPGQAECALRLAVTPQSSEFESACLMVLVVLARGLREIAGNLADDANR